MSVTQEEITEFIRKALDYDGPLSTEDDIFDRLQMDGDDCTDLLEDYSQHFNVDISGMLWYFHYCADEGFLMLSGWPIKPPYRRVEAIPITIAMLTGFANSGSWDLDYPAHILPKRRYDLLNPIINIGLIAMVMIALAG